MVAGLSLLNNCFQAPQGQAIDADNMALTPKLMLAAVGENTYDRVSKTGPKGVVY